jgi:cell division protein FtsQ
VTLWSAVGLAAAWVAYDFGHFLLFSPEMALVHPEQVHLAGNHYVPHASVLEIFAEDRGKSVLRIPLGERRRQLEAIPWVERAIVRRALPNRIEVEIFERTPVAFLRQGDDMALVDAHGVILERPLEGDFHFPVVTGIGPDMPLEEREQRMQLFCGFTEQIESARSDAIEHVSEVDLSDERDVRATLTGLDRGEAAPGAASGTLGQPDVPVLVHFGDSDFAGKYQTLVENIGQWRATAGNIESVDLRFSREAVVNPDASAVARQRSSKQAVASAAKHSR